MSILINMEMPNKKNGAVLIIYPDGKCAFEDGKTYQAVPVPPHGNLIDLSAKVNAQYYDDADEEWSIKTVTVEDILYGICEEMPPIIIPAEESE